MDILIAFLACAFAALFGISIGYGIGRQSGFKAGQRTQISGTGYAKPKCTCTHHGGDWDDQLCPVHGKRDECVIDFEVDPATAAAIAGVHRRECLKCGAIIYGDVKCRCEA